MKLPWKICLVLALIAFAGTTAVRAQGVTTSAVTGLVTDSASIPVAGARVAAVHVPSGSAYTAATRSDGRFTIPGMRVGGPYRVTVSMVGYRRQVQDNVIPDAGRGRRRASFVMGQVSVELEAITVSGATDAVFSSQRTGAATAVPSEQITRCRRSAAGSRTMLRLTPEYSPELVRDSRSPDSRTSSTT